jgi:hypothetical protein
VRSGENQEQENQKIRKSQNQEKTKKKLLQMKTASTANAVLLLFLLSPFQFLNLPLLL